MEIQDPRETQSCGPRTMLQQIVDQRSLAQTLKQSALGLYCLHPVMSTCSMLVQIASGLWWNSVKQFRQKKIELANFELFSSSPKEFTVSVSDRYPSREWSSVGHFTAQDERTIQSFDLHPHLFGKFIKVELHSHYGSEHFCPVSLFRVYGTSEFEVLETEEERESVLDIDDDDDDEPLGNCSFNVDTGEPPKNLFGSARDAVMSIVKKAAEALVKGGNAGNESTELVSSSEVIGEKNATSAFCVTPSHIIVCDNCSDILFGSVYELVSCRSSSLLQLLKSSFVQETMRGDTCTNYGLDFRTGAPYPVRPSLEGKVDRVNYLSALLPQEYIAALCNVLAILEKKVVLNTSYTTNLTEVGQTFVPDKDFEALVLQPTEVTCTVDPTISTPACDIEVQSGKTSSSLSADCTVTSGVETVASMIKPTKTLRDGERLELSKSSAIDEMVETSFSLDTTLDVQVTTAAPLDNQTTVDPAQNRTVEEEVAVPEQEPAAPPVASDQQKANELSGGQEQGLEQLSIDQANLQPQDLSLDTLLSELKDVAFDTADPNVNIATVPPPGSGDGARVLPPGEASSTSSPTQQVLKESVFVRLANRIKALERNMSLSAQYLEELSRRYKRQVEDMQRAFNKTLVTISESGKKSLEREQKQSEDVLTIQQQLVTLTGAVSALVQERDSWGHKANVLAQHAILIIIEVVIFLCVLYFCRQSAERRISAQRMNIPNRSRQQQVKASSTRTRPPKRRKSVEGVSGHQSPRARKRRPSEEALNIAGTYCDLLITESSAPTQVPPLSSFPTEVDGNFLGSKADNKRRRRKKKDLRKSSSSLALNHRMSIPTLMNGIEDLSETKDLPRRASSSEVVKWVSNGVQWVEAPENWHGWTWHGVPPGFQPAPAHVEETRSQSEPFQEEQQPPPAAAASKEALSNPSLDLLKPGGSDTTSTISSSHTNGSIPSSSKQKSRRTSTPFLSLARNLSQSGESSPQTKLKSDNWEWYSRNPKRENSVGAVDKSSQSSVIQNASGSVQNQPEEARSRQGSTGENSRDKKNEKVGGGLKKIVRKFF